MDARFIRFQCPNCQARIKAPIAMAGQSRQCPGCTQAFVVPRNTPEDCGPILVPVERENHFSLISAHRKHHVGSRTGHSRRGAAQPLAMA